MQSTLCSLCSLTQPSTRDRVFFFACKCEHCRVKLDRDARGVVFQPGGLWTDSRTRRGENAERGLRNGIQLLKIIYIYIFIILLRACMCCRGQRLTRPSQSGPCREVRRHLFFEWFWLGSAAGWCNSRKYRPSAVLAAASVHEWQTTVNAKRN